VKFFWVLIPSDFRFPWITKVIGLQKGKGPLDFGFWNSARHCPETQMIGPKVFAAAFCKGFCILTDAFREPVRMQRASSKRPRYDREAIYKRLKPSQMLLALL